MDENQYDSDCMEEAMMEMLFEDDSSTSSTSSSTSSLNSSAYESTDSSTERNVQERRTCVRVKNYVENIVANYDEHQFQEYFRMTRGTTEFVIGKITTAAVLPEHSFGREKINPKKAFLLTLWYVSNTETFRQVSDRFDVSKSSAHTVIKTIMKYLVSVSNEYIEWPTGEYADEVVTAFSEISGISGIVGAIDGTLIRIRRPLEDQEAYYSRKGFHAIQLQVVCDHKKRFTDIFCGEAGSQHDGRCFRKSSLFDKGENNQLNINNNFILGDSAYPSLRWLVPPFKDDGHLTENHHIFNYRHSSSRIKVEHSIGLLKCRFRRLLHGFENKNIDFIVLCVVGACVLHNICINLNDVEVQDHQEIDDDNLHIDEVSEQAYHGISRREELFQIMFQS